jgi:spermidine synthase
MPRSPGLRKIPAKLRVGPPPALQYHADMSGFRERSDQRVRPWSRRETLLALCGGLGALGTAGWPRTVLAREERLLEEARSPFNHVQVTERGSIRTLYFVVDDTRYIESRWDMEHPKSLDLDYSRTMMAGFLVQPRPRRMMMMGLGGGQITNYLFERFPEMEIDAVDIDPEVVRLARKYFGVPDDPRYRTHVADGRLAIERGTQPWDLIMLDAFRGVFVPAHLKTVEFYRACLDHLGEHGVVVANLHNQSRMYPHDRQTLAQVFPNRYSFVSESRNQTTFVASAMARRLGPYELRENAESLRDRFDFDIMGLAARYYQRCDWETNSAVLRDDFDPAQLEDAAERHNKTCITGCAYPAG